MMKLLYMGESDDYKYLFYLNGKRAFDRTQVFMDGKYIYKYSTKNREDTSQTEKEDIIDLISNK
jgi:hypothetical protein